MGKRKSLPTHRLYILFIDESKTQSSLHYSISSAWFAGNDAMKRYNVKEIRIIKINP